MATTVEWLEQFTGRKVADGASSGVDPEAAAAAFEKEQALKAALLAQAHKKVAPLKGEFQQAMASEVKVKGSIFKQKMLDVKGTQIDEADFNEIDFSAIDLEPATQAIVSRGSMLIALQGESLAAATTERNGKQDILFKPIEIEDGYWFPLTRERILPETFIGDLYSKTQRMLDETNALYLAEVERKREKGELTPKANRVRDLCQSGADVLMLGADMVGAFGPGTADAKLAITLLTGMSGVISGAGDAYDKLRAKEYADGASAALGTLQVLTKMILGSVGVDKRVIDTVDKSFTIGGKAIIVGKHFARGVDGAADGVSVFADVLAGALSIASTQTSGDTQKQLQLALVAAPNALKGAATSGKLLQALDKGEPTAVFDCIGEFSSIALNTVQGVKKIESTQGKSAQEKEKIEGGIDKETAKIQGYIDLGTAGGKTAFAMAISIRRGSYQAAFDAMVDGIGNSLTQALSSAGLPEDTAKKIGLLYKSASSGVKALECLIVDVNDTAGALQHLSVGIGGAFEGLAPGNTDLQRVGQSLALAIKSLADVKTFHDKCAAGDFDGAMNHFTSSFMTNLKGAFKIGGLESGEDEEEGDEEGGSEEDSPLKLQLLALGVEAKRAEKLIAAHVDDVLEAEVAKQTKAEAEEEAQAILEEAKAELSDPEKFSRDASDIDRLIQKMLLDQMIMKIAVQVMQGGTAFLATFIPGLGAAPAAIKMMASLVTAAQRAQQLAYWVNSQKDFEAAQSALSSSASNFVRNQAEQFSHHSIQAAFAAAEMIGQVLRVAGAATYGAMEAAGAGLVAASKAGAKLEEIIRRHHKAEALEAAWRTTKRALENPSNRKLGLKARAQNPSLAKYSIAWGAVCLKDPLARNALRACNLTEAVLENENANVDKVVQYLEVFYEEDDKLYREVEEAAPWVPADIQLNLRFWAKMKKLAVENVKLANPDTGVLDGQLAMLKGDISKAGPVELQQRIELLKNIERSLAAYAPEIANAKGLKAFQGVVLILRKQAKAGVKAIESRVEKALQAKQQINEKAAKERQEALKKKEFVIEQLGGMTGTLEEFEADDDPVEMQIAFAEAQKLLQEIGDLEAFKADREVIGAMTRLRSASEDLDSLIVLSAQTTA